MMKTKGRLLSMASALALSGMVSMVMAGEETAPQRQAQAVSARRDISTPQGAYLGHWKVQMTKAEEAEWVEAFGSARALHRYVSKDAIDGKTEYFIPSAAAVSFSTDGWFTLAQQAPSAKVRYCLAVFVNPGKTRMLECEFMGSVGYKCQTFNYVDAQTQPPVEP